MEDNSEIVSTLKEILKWQKISALPSLKNILVSTLDKHEKLIVYELTDGEKNRDEIMKESGSGAGTISGWWIEWCSKGILEKNGSKYKKVISLNELGIKIPKIEKRGVIENARTEEQQQQN